MSKIPFATNTDANSSDLFFSNKNGKGKSLDNIFETILNSVKENIFGLKNEASTFEGDLQNKNHGLSKNTNLTKNTETNNLSITDLVLDKNTADLESDNLKSKNLLEVNISNDLPDEKDSIINIFNFSIINSEVNENLKKNINPEHIEETQNTDFEIINTIIRKKGKKIVNNKNLSLNNKILDPTLYENKNTPSHNEIIKKVINDKNNDLVRNDTKKKFIQGTKNIFMKFKKNLDNNNNLSEKILISSAFKNNKILSNNLIDNSKLDENFEKNLNSNQLQFNNNSQNNKSGNNSFANQNILANNLSKDSSTLLTDTKPFSNLQEKWLNLIDMGKDNWTENLLKKIEKNFSNGKSAMEFELKPKNLGKLKVSILLTKEQTNIQMRTETVQVAQMINDAESKLSQMFENVGIKLGYLGTAAGYNHNKGSGYQNSDQTKKDQNKDNELDNESINETENDLLSANDNLVNVKA